MLDNTAQVMLTKTVEKPDVHLGLTQLIFWLLIGVISLFTLTLWYGQEDWPYLYHLFLQAFMCLMLALPFYCLLVKIWKKPVNTRRVNGIITALFVSLFLTLLTIKTFNYLTAEKNIWADFSAWYFNSLFVFIGWMALFHFTIYYKLLQFEHRITISTEAKIQQEQLKRIKAQSVAKDAQLKMLRYQLNPHFLYNTLNAINALIESKEQKKAQQVTIKLSRFLRYSLEENPESTSTLAEEIVMLHLFLDIEKVRFGDRLQLNFLIDEQAKNAQIPSLLLQPIIENSMKHAIAKNETGGTINVSATVSTHSVNKKLIIELSDSGSDNIIDIDTLTSGNFTGVGLHNIKNRLALIFKSNYLFNMSLTPTGALKTTIAIPWQQQITIPLTSPENRHE